MAKTKIDPSKQVARPMAGLDTRTPEQVWREIEEDLRRGPGPKRGRVVALAIGVLCLMVGSFALGWNLAPSPEAQVTPSVSTQRASFTESSLAAKRDGLAVRYGAEFGPVVAAPATARTPGAPFTSTALASKHAALALRYGAEFGPVVAAVSAPGTGVVAPQGRDGLSVRYGSEFGSA
jgi:hypothetical protein